MNKKVLITGITGMLGSSIYAKFLKEKNFEIYGITRNNKSKLEGVELLYGDLSNIEFYSSLKDTNFSVVVHCAAETDLTKCEQLPSHAEKMNVLSTKLLFEQVKSEKYFYISTDSVFDGKKGEYNEADITNPLNVYAKSKYEAEKLIINKNCYILRTNIYGFSNPLKNSLFEWAIKQLTYNTSINGYTNVFFNPLSIDQISEIIFMMISKDAEFGVYNLGSNDYVSKYSFLKIIAERLQKGSLVNPIKLEHQIGLQRPLNTTLCNKKISDLFPNYNFNLQNGIEKTIDSYILKYKNEQNSFK